MRKCWRQRRLTGSVHLLWWLRFVTSLHHYQLNTSLFTKTRTWVRVVQAEYWTIHHSFITIRDLRKVFESFNLPMRSNLPWVRSTVDLIFEASFQSMGLSKWLSGPRTPHCKGMLATQEHYYGVTDRLVIVTICALSLSSRIVWIWSRIDHTLVNYFKTCPLVYNLRICYWLITCF